MSSLAVPPPAVPVLVWGGGLVTWLHLDIPAENGEYCRGIMHWPVHFFPWQMDCLYLHAEALSYKEKTSEEVHHLSVSAIATVEDLHKHHVITVAPD